MVTVLRHKKCPLRPNGQSTHKRHRERQWVRSSYCVPGDRKELLDRLRATNDREELTKSAKPIQDAPTTRNG